MEQSLLSLESASKAEEEAARATSADELNTLKARMDALLGELDAYQQAIQVSYANAYSLP